MDIKLENDDYKFILRSSAVIYNKDKTKVLLFKVKDKDFYTLPGGKIKQLETSIDAINREIREEIGFENIDFEFYNINESIINQNNIVYQQVELIYKGIYMGEIDNNIVNSLEGDWCYFEWIDKNEIKNMEIVPKKILQHI